VNLITAVQVEPPNNGFFTLNSWRLPSISIRNMILPFSTATLGNSMACVIFGEYLTHPWYIRCLIISPSGPVAWFVLHTLPVWLSTPRTALFPQKPEPSRICISSLVLVPLRASRYAGASLASFRLCNIDKQFWTSSLSFPGILGACVANTQMPMPIARPSPPIAIKLRPPKSMQIRIQIVDIQIPRYWLGFSKKETLPSAFCRYHLIVLRA